MQVQFVLHRILATLQPLEQARRQVVAPIAGHIAGFQWRAVAQQPGEFASRFGLVTFGHARARLGPRRGRGRFGILAQRRHFADGRTEQGGRIFVFRVRHAHRVNRRRRSAYDGSMSALTAGRGRRLPQGSTAVPPTLHGDGIEFLENQAVKSKMRILVSNDDGVDAAGIRMLASVLREAGHEVTVVAPDRDRSGASNSLTLDLPIRLKRIDHYTVSVAVRARHCRVRHQQRRQPGR
ncbi:hypothetical protein G6F57_017337 [Rhizopus arrhizus]|nr:hypothetical protein G6F57_017337 [Rhizopus arrhizus]